jgi:hypothetical protein
VSTLQVIMQDLPVPAETIRNAMQKLGCDKLDGTQALFENPHDTLLTPLRLTSDCGAEYQQIGRISPSSSSRGLAISWPKQSSTGWNLGSATACAARSHHSPQRHRRRHIRRSW